MRILLGFLAILGATFFHYIGETDNVFNIKPNKWYKTLMGIPIALCLCWFNTWALLSVLTYFIALQFGYGDNNWTVKLFGKTGAIIFCGALMGLASFPVIGYWAILQTIISGYNFYWLDKHQEVVEPRVAIQRSIIGCICLL